jgi:hypothetical protein
MGLKCAVIFIFDIYDVRSLPSQFVTYMHNSVRYDLSRAGVAGG